MSFLGDTVYAHEVVVETLKTQGVAASTTLQNVSVDKLDLADDTGDRVKVFHTGSLLVLEYDKVVQAVSMSTVASSTSITVMPLTQIVEDGDTVEISEQGIPGDLDTVPAESLYGSLLVTSVNATTNAFTFTVSAAAAASVTSTDHTPQIKVRYYKYIDLASSTSTWTHATSLPASHANPPTLFF